MSINKYCISTMSYRKITLEIGIFWKHSTWGMADMTFPHQGKTNGCLPLTVEGRWKTSPLGEGTLW